MTLTTIWAKIVSAVTTLGYLKFGLLVVACVILWRINKILGIIGALILVAVLVGLI